MIRKAKLSELLEVGTLIKIGANMGQVLIRSKDDIKKNIGNFFVAVGDGKIIGCCALDIYSEKLAEIRSLVVLPEYQNRGIGGKLIKRCLEKAVYLGIYQVLAVTDRHKLFKTAGFVSKLNKKTPMFMNLTKI